MVYTVCFYLCAQGGVYIIVGLVCTEYVEDKVATLVCHWLDDCGRDFFFTVFPIMFF